MKKSFKFLLFCSLFGMIASCKKKEYTCGHSIFYQPVSIVFKGFSAADLGKVVVKSYQPNGQYNQLLSVDTFDYSSANFRGDTAYVHIEQYDVNIGFYDLNLGKDYTITILSTNDNYSISNIRNGDATTSWIQNDECSMGAGQAEIEALLLNVNGKAASTFYMDTNRFLVCLSH